MHRKVVQRWLITTNAFLCLHSEKSKALKSLSQNSLKHVSLDNHIYATLTLIVKYDNA